MRISDWSSDVCSSDLENASLLQADPSCAGETLCPLIPLRAPQRFWGFEGSADWAVTPQLDLGAVLTWQPGKIFADAEGRYIPSRTHIVAPFRLTGSANYRPVHPRRLSPQGHHSTRARHI